MPRYYDSALLVSNACFFPLLFDPSAPQPTRKTIYLPLNLMSPLNGHEYGCSGVLDPVTCTVSPPEGRPLLCAEQRPWNSSNSLDAGELSILFFDLQGSAISYLELSIREIGVLHYRRTSSELQSAFKAGSGPLPLEAFKASEKQEILFTFPSIIPIVSSN